MKAPTEDELKAIEAATRVLPDGQIKSDMLRLVTEVRRLGSVTDLLVELSEFLDGQCDIVDGDWPDPPKPNRAMQLKHEIDVFLGTAVEGY